LGSPVTFLAMDRADREGRTLRDIIDTVPATNPDTVVDSCSNSSDDDEPKCIPETPNPLGYTKMNTNTYPAGPSSRETKVEKTTTWGGRTKYQVSRPTQQAYYYMVQW